MRTWSEIYFNTEKSACIKCHRLETSGQSVPTSPGGPALFQNHLIESIWNQVARCSGLSNMSVRLKMAELTGVRSPK